MGKRSLAFIDINLKLAEIFQTKTDLIYKSFVGKIINFNF